MDKVYKIDYKNGYYLFKLEKMLNDKHISKNKIMRDTNTDFKVLQRILKGESIRIDLDVLARFCDYLDCNPNDIFEYIKKKKD